MKTKWPDPSILVINFEYKTLSRPRYNPYLLRCSKSDSISRLIKVHYQYEIIKTQKQNKLSNIYLLFLNLNIILTGMEEQYNVIK